MAAAAPALDLFRVRQQMEDEKEFMGEMARREMPPGLARDAYIAELGRRVCSRYEEMEGSQREKRQRGNSEGQQEAYDNAANVAAGEEEAQRGGDNDNAPAQLQTVEDRKQPYLLLSNFGMPLLVEPGVTVIDKRYLVESKPDTPWATSEMLRLLMHPRVGIRSPMDTAKSTAFLMYTRYLLKRFPDIRIVFVTPRVTLAMSLKQRMEAMGIPCCIYAGNTVETLREAQVAIVQLDSICKLKGATPYDVVLLDESESTLFHFGAATLSNKTEVWQWLCVMAEQASQLVLLDAHLGKRSQTFLKQKQPKGQRIPGFLELLETSNAWSGSHGGVLIWDNQRKTDCKRYYRHVTADTFHATLHEYLRKGKKVAIVSNVCKKAKQLFTEIRDKYSGLKVLLLTSESSHEDKTADCNTTWPLYDVVIYSPTVGAGVDFNPESGAHFDVVFGWGGSNSNPAREFVQMLGRVRKPRDGEVHLHMPTGKVADVFCTPESVDMEIETCWDDLNKHNELDPALRQLSVKAGGLLHVGYNDESYRMMFIINLLESRLSKQGLFVDFVWQAITANLDTENGGRIFYIGKGDVDPQTAFEAKADMKEAARRQETEEQGLLARDRFASEKERDEAKARLTQQQGTERDKRLMKREQLISGIHAYEVAMVAPPDARAQRGTPDAEAMGQTEEQASDGSHSTDRPTDSEPADAVTSKFREFISLYGDTADCFRLFCMANLPVTEAKKRWAEKAARRPGEDPMLMPEYSDAETARLVKGLLRATGFLEERLQAMLRAQGGVPLYVPDYAWPPSPPIAQQHGQAQVKWEDGGDLCSMDTVDTETVQASVGLPDTRDWLDKNAEKIRVVLGCNVSAGRLESGQYSGLHVLRALRTALGKVGIRLSDGTKRNKRLDNSRKTISSWSLQTAQRDAWLEMAYSGYKRGLGVSGQKLYSEWGIEEKLERMQPVFNWQLITGMSRPMHWPVRANESKQPTVKPSRKRKAEAGH